MGTPTLSKKQIKQTLSAKKSRKGPVRTVLASPYCNYWPLLTTEDSRVLIELLTKHLQIVKQEKPKIPWKELKFVSRENRKEFRENYSKVTRNIPDKTQRLDISFGVNEVTKLLEKDEAGTILIASDVNPQLMVRHIIDMAVLKRRPVLIVPQLRETLKVRTGLNSVAIAFKNGLNMDSDYWAIDKKIKELHGNYPVPENHINYQRSQTDFIISEKDLNYANADVITKTKDFISISNSNSSDDEPEINFYLLRSSNNERVFVPPEWPTEEQTTAAPSRKIDVCTDFIPFSKDVNLVSGVDDRHGEFPLLIKNRPKDKFKRNKLSYRSLVVKRVKSDVDRNKKKIQMLKNKRKINKNNM